MPIFPHQKVKASEHHKIDKADVKGTGDICDMADNVYLVWRDKSKRTSYVGDVQFAPETDKPDVYLTIDKARNGRFEGDIGLWFRPDSLQYVASSDAGTIEYGGR